MATRERIEKVESVLRHRQKDLVLVLEDIKNPHNASALLRTADAAGVQHVYIIDSMGEEFPVNESISTGAEKWLTLHYYTWTVECLQELKEKGFRILATYLGEDSVSHFEVDFTLPSAIVFGNEKMGVSQDVLDMADVKVKIPMFGMVQSLNVSVSAGVILYEAVRQRLEKGMYGKLSLNEQEYQQLRKRFLEGG